MLTMEFLQSVVDVENEIAYREGRQPSLVDRRFEQFFEHVSRLPDVLRANIYTPDRKVIWSSDPRSNMCSKKAPTRSWKSRSAGRCTSKWASPERTIRSPSARI